MVLDGMLSTGSDRLIDRRVFYCRETLPITLAGATVEMGSSAKIYKTEISVDSIRNIDKYLTTATMIINIPILSTYIIIYIHDIRIWHSANHTFSLHTLLINITISQVAIL